MGFASVQPIPQWGIRERPEADLMMSSRRRRGAKGRRLHSWLRLAPLCFEVAKLQPKFPFFLCLSSHSSGCRELDSGYDVLTHFHLVRADDALSRRGRWGNTYTSASYSFPRSEQRRWQIRPRVSSRSSHVCLERWTPCGVMATGAQSWPQRHASYGGFAEVSRQYSQIWDEVSRTAHSLTAAWEGHFHKSTEYNNYFDVSPSGFTGNVECWMFITFLMKPLAAQSQNVSTHYERL